MIRQQLSKKPALDQLLNQSEINMELQLPVALQIALYVAAGGIIVFVVGLAIAVFYLKKQIDRVVDSVENLKAMVEPLAQETRIAVEKIRTLTARVQEKWLAVESLLETVRDWGRQANRLVEKSTNVVTAPVQAATQRVQILMKGMQTFFHVLLSRTE